MLQTTETRLPEQHEPEKRKIFVVGGYGVVGSRIVARLARDYPDRIVVAGRSPEKANRLATKTGRGTKACAVDVLQPSTWNALENAVLVVVCKDQTDTQFVAYCLEKGLAYVDITARDTFLSDVEGLHETARRTGATALLSVGVAPGLSTLLAAHAMKSMQRVERIDLLVELGLGDVHGRAAIDWMLQGADADFIALEHGRKNTVRSLSQKTVMAMPADAKKRAAYRFNFGEQHLADQAGGAPVASWFRLSNDFLTWIMVTFARRFASTIRRSKWRRAAALWLLEHLRFFGSDRCGVLARVEGFDRTGRTVATAAIVGRREAVMTAIVATDAVRQVMVRTSEAGVFHSSQIMELDPIITALKSEIPDLVVALSNDPHAAQ